MCYCHKPVVMPEGEPVIGFETKTKRAKNCVFFQIYIFSHFVLVKVIYSSLDKLCLSLKNIEIINQFSDEFEICDNNGD